MSIKKQQLYLNLNQSETLYIYIYFFTMLNIPILSVLTFLFNETEQQSLTEGF